MASVNSIRLTTSMRASSAIYPLHCSFIPKRKSRLPLSSRKLRFYRVVQHSLDKEHMVAVGEVHPKEEGMEEVDLPVVVKHQVEEVHLEVVMAEEDSRTKNNKN